MKRHDWGYSGYFLSNVLSRNQEVMARIQEGKRQIQAIWYLSEKIVNVNLKSSMAAYDYKKREQQPT